MNFVPKRIRRIGAQADIAKKIFPLCTFAMLSVVSAWAKAYTPGTIFTVAGYGTAGYSGDGGAATNAGLHYPNGVALDASGNLYIADFDNNRIRKVIAASGIISTIAGNGTGGYSGDNGPATAAELFTPAGVAVDASGDIFIADYNNNRIREIFASNGNITTVAGTGTAGYSGDNGAALAANLHQPLALTLDPSGDVIFADSANNVIREVFSGAETITTIAGNGSPAYGGDGLSATAATLSAPGGIARDSSGNLYIGDTGNERVRMVAASTGIISTFAGNGTAGFGGDGSAAGSAELNTPEGVAVDLIGNVFVADWTNGRVREIAAGTHIITTIAGSGSTGYSGDGGPADSAEMWTPSDVKLDSFGNLFIADFNDEVIRMVYEAPSAWQPSVPGTNVHNPSSVAPPGTIVAYPQPAQTSICFLADMQSTGLLIIEVYNAAKQHVATFRENVSSVGYDSYCENLGPMANGAYIYYATLNSAHFPESKFWVFR